MTRRGAARDVESMAEKAKAWAASEDGKKAMEQAAATAREAVEQMRKAQDTQPAEVCRFTC